MIKNKEILALIEQKKREISCDNCKHCDQGAYHSGKWYCKKKSVFDCSIQIQGCFERS